MRVRLAAAAVAAVTALATGSGGDVRAQAPVLVLLPLDNLSGAARARSLVSERVVAALERKGYRVAWGEDVAAVLESERIRYMDALPPESRAAVMERFGAAGFVSGAVDTFVEGAQPAVAVSLRIVRADGTPAWADVTARTAADTAGLFGAGRADTVELLVNEVVDRVMEGVPAPGAEAREQPLKAKPFRLRGPHGVVTPALEVSGLGRVAVLPFENTSADPRAARIVGRLLEWRLRQAGVDVVEPADLRAAMRAQRLRSFRRLDPEQVLAVGERVGTTMFIRGTVETFRDVSARSAGEQPRVGVNLMLVDVSASRILWSCRHERAGQDYAFLLQRGAVSNAVSLADRVVSEMADGLGPALVRREPRKGAALQ